MNRLSSVLTAIAVLVSVFVSPLPAEAKRVSQECDGGYLVGFNTMRGVWLDRIGAICRAWDPATKSLGGEDNKPLLARSGGGGAQRLRCEDGFAVVDLEYYMPTIQGQGVAEQVTLTCQRVKWPHNGSVKPQPTLHTTGDLRSDNDASCMGVCASGTHMPIEACDVGQIATGFDADVNEFVGKLKLHCGPWPNESAAEPHHRPRFPRHPIPGIGGSSTSTTPVAPSGTIEGDWNTTEGLMALQQDDDEVNGSYGSDDGVINVQQDDDDDSKWSGIWAEKSSAQRCDKEKLDTHYWGGIEMTFSNGNRHFDAKWSYCKEPTANGKPWTGDRIK